jgi:hypothetical protein
VTKSPIVSLVRPSEVAVQEAGHSTAHYSNYHPLPTYASCYYSTYIQLSPAQPGHLVTDQPRPLSTALSGLLAVTPTQLADYQPPPTPSPSCLSNSTPRSWASSVRVYGRLWSESSHAEHSQAHSSTRSLRPCASRTPTPIPWRSRYEAAPRQCVICATKITNTMTGQDHSAEAVRCPTTTSPLPS